MRHYFKVVIRLWPMPYGPDIWAFAICPFCAPSLHCPVHASWSDSVTHESDDEFAAHVCDAEATPFRNSHRLCIVISISSLFTCRHGTTLPGYQRRVFGSLARWLLVPRCSTPYTPSGRQHAGLQQKGVPSFGVRAMQREQSHCKPSSCGTCTSATLDDDAIGLPSEDPSGPPA